jgi:hypothetical protein
MYREYTPPPTIARGLGTGPLVNLRVRPYEGGIPLRRYLIAALLGGALLTGCGAAMRPDANRTPARTQASRVAPTSPARVPDLTPATPDGRVPGVPGPTPLTPGAPAGPNPTRGPDGTMRQGMGPVGATNASRARTVAQAANNVPGVGQAWALVNGNTTVVGLRPDGRTAGVTTQNLEMSVANAVRAADPTLTQIYVTTRPNVVESLRLIDHNAARGYNLTRLDDQMQGIINYLNANRAGVMR